MITWLTETTVGKILATFFISMLPVVELRGGLPFGIAHGLDYWVALTVALAGNFVPVPLIIIYIKRIFAWLRKRMPKFDGAIGRLEEKARKKGKLVRRYSLVGLVILVGIPLPGTGAWTGALVAALLRLRLRHAIPAILVGLLMAAAITTLMTFGVIHLL